MKKYQIIDLSILKGAIFSDDGKYRYALWRVWNINKSILNSIGLNSSTANANNEDPTITRDMKRAYLSGFGGLIKTNLYGFVTPYPEELLGDGDFGHAIGEFNDYYLKQAIRLSACHLCGWGSFKAAKLRASSVLAMIAKPYCLGVNADGQPKHPLYVSYDTPMVKYCWGNEVESDIEL